MFVKAAAFGVAGAVSGALLGWLGGIVVRQARLLRNSLLVAKGRSGYRDALAPELYLFGAIAGFVAGAVLATWFGATLLGVVASSAVVPVALTLIGSGTALSRALRS